VTAPRRPAISVVLSTFGNHDVLRRVLDGYDRQDAPAGTFELLLVVDRKEPDPDAVTAAIGERRFPLRRLVGRVPGLSANRNTGWREARAPIVQFADNDTIPSPGLVAEHLSWHRRHPEPEVAVVGHVRWARELSTTPFMRWLDDGVQFHFGSIRGTEAGWAHLYGANSSIKRAFIEEVGDWDEVRFPYLYDDLDWAIRARDHGLRVLYNRAAVVDHLRHDATVDFWKRKMRLLAQTERRFCTVHPEVSPWFHHKFLDAVSCPPARERGVKVLRFLPRWVPWLGSRAWTSADLWWRQQLAPHFLAAWDEADVDGAAAAQSELAEFMEQPRGDGAI
jgi:GT2 family glycosyltransferase